MVSDYDVGNEREHVSGHRTDPADERRAQGNLDRFARRAVALGSGTVEPHPLNFRTAQVAAENEAASSCDHFSAEVDRLTDLAYRDNRSQAFLESLRRTLALFPADESNLAQSVETDHGGVVDLARHPAAKRAEERLYADINLPTGGAR